MCPDTVLVLSILRNHMNMISVHAAKSACFDNFPALFFLFSGTWLEVDPSDYLVDVSEGKDESLCLMLLT